MDYIEKITFSTAAKFVAAILISLFLASKAPVDHGLAWVLIAIAAIIVSLLLHTKEVNKSWHTEYLEMKAQYDLLCDKLIEQDAALQDAAKTKQETSEILKVNSELLDSNNSLKSEIGLLTANNLSLINRRNLLQAEVASLLPLKNSLEGFESAKSENEKLLQENEELKAKYRKAINAVNGYKRVMKSIKENESTHDKDRQ